jgi:hypothetical protein
MSVMRPKENLSRGPALNQFTVVDGKDMIELYSFP